MPPTLSRPRAPPKVTVAVQSTPTLARRAFTVLALTPWVAPAPTTALTNPSPAPVTIAVSVPAIQTFANRIGGRHVHAETLAPPCRDPDRIGADTALAALGAARLFIYGRTSAEASWLARLRDARLDHLAADYFETMHRAETRIADADLP